MLGPILCWAVVFADIGTSVYYTPGILYQTVGGLAGFFVFLTMFVFVLLTLKYAEVTHRFPQGGGVVTVAAQAINPWFGSLGGMFILVDYFLTAAISSISGILYFSVVVPAFTPYALWITVGVLALLGILNWVGISESAKVSLVGAVIAFISDVAILFTIFTHVSLTQFFELISHMFASRSLTWESLLAGFAGAFLAFSGLESISQLSPVMKQPHKKVAGLALLMVVLTIGLTSPLLTMFSTLLLPKAASDPILKDQLISLLAGHWGGTWGQILQIEVAISASALLVFASNTAIIGAYHVFMALSRMEFLPGFILRRNKLRGTPHYSIALATGIPIAVLILVNGNTTILGDMYAFGLLGAFSLTCLGLDIVRFRDWQRTRANPIESLAAVALEQGNGHLSDELAAYRDMAAEERHQSSQSDQRGTLDTGQLQAGPAERVGVWFRIDFFLGVLTTILVIVAWSTNLITKPLATVFGGGVTVVGMAVAYVNYARNRKEGKVPVPVVATRIEERMPNAILAILSADSPHKEAVIRSAVANAEANQPLVFLYLGQPRVRAAAPRMMEIVDPYLEDPQAKNYFSKAAGLAMRAKQPIRFIYLQGGRDLATQVWQLLRPHDTVIAAEESEQIQDINPDRIRYERTPAGKVAHLLKAW